jgi:hypothetical protein
LVLAIEMGTSGVQVDAVASGIIDTPIFPRDEQLWEVLTHARAERQDRRPSGHRGRHHGCTAVVRRSRRDDRGDGRQRTGCKLSAAETT